MPKILNYTTTVDATKTVAEIQKILSAHGVKQISVIYEGGEPDGMRFVIEMFGQPIEYRMPCNVKGVFGTLTRTKGVPSAKQTTAQARRVAWRILKDWVEAQMAMVQAENAGLAEMFFTYATDQSGKTFFQHFSETKKKELEGKQNLQLTSGSAE